MLLHPSTEGEAQRPRRVRPLRYGIPWVIDSHTHEEIWHPLNAHHSLLFFAVKQDFYHPFHLHGHRFIITDMGMLPDEAKTLRLKYLQEREFTRRPNSHNPPYKDTISIPNEGYVKVRFRANNAGRFCWELFSHFSSKQYRALEVDKKYCIFLTGFILI